MPDRVETARLAGVSFQQAGQPSLEEHFRATEGVIEVMALATAAWAASPSSLRPAATPPGRSPITGSRSAQATASWAAWASWRARSRRWWSPRAARWSGSNWRMDRIDGPIYPAVKHQPVPIYPLSWQDFSLVWDVARGYSALEGRLAAFAHPLVRSREFVYAYKGKGLPPGKGSYTYRFWIGAADQYACAEEIEHFRARRCWRFWKRSRFRWR